MSPDSGSSRSGASVSILIVEDERPSALALAELLRLDGHWVVVTGGFEDAVDVAKQARFQVALCNIGLPDGDGFGLLGALRAMYPIAGIAITADADPQHAERCRQAGFAAHLFKPVDYQILRDVLKAVAADASA